MILPFKLAPVSAIFFWGGSSGSAHGYYYFFPTLVVVEIKGICFGGDPQGNENFPK